MGLFSKLFGKSSGDSFQEPSPSPSSSNNGNSLNLKKQEALNTLNLRKNTLNTLCLKKTGLKDLQARVCVAMDFSGSMEAEYKYGRVQELFERLFPLALKFDDNGELECWIFSNGCRRLENITEDNFFGYVNNEIINKRYSMNGTEYAPVIKDITKKYVQELPESSIPTYVIFITDGDNSDHRATEKAISDASHHNIFWQFVGIGNSSFDFLEKLDEMDGRFVDNANFFECNDVKKVSDEDLYSKLLHEFPSWIEKAKKLQILK